MNWDALAAIATTGGVVLATVLGLLAVRIAMKTVVRSELDYLGQRGDAFLAASADFTSLLGQYMAALHVFWKEHPDRTAEFYDDPQIAGERAATLRQLRLEAEVKVHQLEYQAEGVAATLRAHLDACDFATISEEKYTGRARALIDLARKSRRLQYLVLVPDDRVLRMTGSELVDDLFSYLTLDGHRGREFAGLNEDSRRWLETEMQARLAAGRGQEAAEIMAIDFQEAFVNHQWETEVRGVAERMYQAATPRRL